MATINHAVEQIATASQWIKFNGLEQIKLTVTLPSWHQPFPTQVRAGAEDPRSLEMVGLLHVSQSWYINGYVTDQWTISTLMGPLHVPAGTRIVSEELPAQWEANGQDYSEGKKEYSAYSNGRTGFC